MQGQLGHLTIKSNLMSNKNATYILIKMSVSGADPGCCIFLFYARVTSASLTPPPFQKKGGGVRPHECVHAPSTWYLRKWTVSLCIQLHNVL